MFSAFIAGNRKWIARHAVPLEVIVRQVLHQHGLQLLRLQQVEPHPVYELSLRLPRSPRASKPEVEQAVRRAFAAVGRSVKPKFAHAIIQGDRVRCFVHVDG